MQRNQNSIAFLFVVGDLQSNGFMNSPLQASFQFKFAKQLIMAVNAFGGHGRVFVKCQHGSGFCVGTSRIGISHIRDITSCTV